MPLIHCSGVPALPVPAGTTGFSPAGDSCLTSIYDTDGTLFMDDEIFEFPVDGTLDLHTFSPGEVKDLVADYIEECRRRSIYQVRIIHGKGTGTLRRTVHGVLKHLPAVRNFSLAQDRGGGGWGATKVDLWPLEKDS